MKRTEPTTVNDSLSRNAFHFEFEGETYRVYADSVFGALGTLEERISQVKGNRTCLCGECRRASVYTEARQVG